VNPVNSHSGFEEVHAYSQLLKSKGFKIWLSIHYSDTWADPGHQQIPQQWQALDLPVLKDSLLRYTAKVVKEIQPDFVQIGNEINSGFLHPLGNIENNYAQFIDLMNTAIEAVRTYAPQTRIILHYAGIENAAWFFEKVKSLDYDIIGLSYYPMWHGKSLELLQQTIDDLAATFSKKVLIAETSYPFTLHWNDLTNNVLGLSEQLILPTYPATPEGQKQYVRRMLEISYESVGCIGLCYWGAELIAWKGPQATDGSAWENQALFDFNSKALPALKEFAAQ
jgi:arabinogalactan endo-1,4-beta-galactosidase